MELAGHECVGFCEFDKFATASYISMGRCKLECPDGETECCICCTKQDSCQCRCDDMDSYEYAEECEDYETD